MDLNKDNLTRNLKEFFEKNPEWEKTAKEMINHGLGFVRQKEHDYLVKEGAIRCDGENDTIIWTSELAAGIMSAEVEVTTADGITTSLESFRFTIRARV